MMMALGTHSVIAGLDPAIHLLRNMMDARVKPAHDQIKEPRKA
jgi:hypothetical protein